MNQQRSRRAKFNSLANVKGKVLIAAVIVSTVGVISVAFAGGVLWAIGFASISTVLILQLATIWKQARTQTERFQHLRNRIDKLTRENTLASDSTGVVGRSPRTEVARIPKPASPSVETTSQQMFDIQRELDYLLWRVSGAGTAMTTEPDQARPGVSPSALLDGSSGR